jgi:hypothetical protein
MKNIFITWTKTRHFNIGIDLHISDWYELSGKEYVKWIELEMCFGTRMFRIQKRIFKGERDKMRGIK